MSLRVDYISTLLNAGHAGPDAKPLPIARHARNGTPYHRGNWVLGPLQGGFTS